MAGTRLTPVGDDDQGELLPRDDAGRLLGSRRKFLTEEQLEVIREAWARGLRRDEVAEAAGITVSRLVARLGDQLAGLPRRGQGFGGGPKRKAERDVDPTDDEIRLRAAEVRRSWGPDRYGIGDPLPEDDPRRLGRVGRYAIHADEE